MEKKSWVDLRDAVQSLLSETKQNRELFHALDAVAAELRQAGLSDHVYLDSRAFGENIFDGTLKRCDSMDDAQRCVTQMCFRDSLPLDLAYANIPLGLLLKNGVEIFSEANEYDSRQKKQPKVHHAPLKLLYQGDLFGVFEALDYLASQESQSHSPWTMSAGARSIQFSYSLGNKNIKKAIESAASIFGVAGDRIPAVQNLRHYDFARRIIKLIDPDWTVDFILFPEAWLFEAKVNESSRTRLENVLFRLGWGQAQPLLKTLSTSDDFWHAWSAKPGLGFDDLPRANDRALGKFAYNLVEIDRGMQPCLMDIRSVLNCPSERLFGQMLPAAELLVFISTIAYFHGVNVYTTFLVPGYASNPGVGYLSLDRDNVTFPDARDDRIEFLKRVFAMLGVPMAGRIPLYGAQKIKADTITLIGGASRGVRDYVMLDIFDCDEDLGPPFGHCQHKTAQFPISPESLVLKRAGEKDIKFPKSLRDYLLKSHEPPGAFGKDGLSFHVRFGTRTL